MTRSKRHRSTTKDQDKRAAQTKEITPSERTCHDDGWRSAIEWLGQPAERRHLEEGYDEMQYPPFPEPAMDEIARITDIRPSMRLDFRVSLIEICRAAFTRALLDDLSSIRRPTVLLNRIAETARKLFRYLMQLEQTDYVTLDGAIGLILPRVLLRARFNPSTMKLEVGCDRSWAFLNVREYADLISGLTDCADVARGRLSMQEAGRRIGVRVRSKSPAPIKINGAFKKARSRRTNLAALIRDLHELIVYKAKGKLTLWREPGSSEMRGTLPAVLNVLRPYLPDVVPEHISYRTLQRYHSFAAKSRNFVSNFSA